LAGVASLEGGKTQAAENAAGIYLLGTKGSMAGFTPPPGTYFVDVNYFYAGDASGNAAVGVALRRLGNRLFPNLPPLTLDIQADIKLDGDAQVVMPSFLWVAPGKVLGGNIGFGAIIPVGRKAIDVDIDALATLTLPLLNTTLERGRRFHFDESTTDFGDPVANALIGWHQGNWHWNIGTLLNIPIGPWSQTSDTNISFNHLALDTTAAVTWLDPKIGWELSSAAGFTFNRENPDTDYETGTEFHVEWALVRHFSKTFALGLVGYHYQQVTGDSGAGARLGDFKGRVIYPDGMVEHDGQVGQMLKAIDDLGLAENTIVMYSTDNGAEKFTWPDGGQSPFRGEKNTNWEGGYRVPAMVRWPGVIKPGTVYNDIVAHEDWIPTLVAAAGNPDVKEQLLKGTKVGDKTFKVHLDGYDITDYLAGKGLDPRRDFIYFVDDGSLVGLRYDQWKIVFAEQREHGLDVWQEPFVPLRLPKLFTLRADPFETADHEGMDYNRWRVEHLFVMVPAQAYVAKFLETFKEFPPRQKPGSFSIDQVMENMQNAGKGGAN
jgi:hypothetical protein